MVKDQRENDGMQCTEPKILKISSSQFCCTSLNSSCISLLFLFRIRQKDIVAVVFYVEAHMLTLHISLLSYLCILLNSHFSQGMFVHY